MPVSDPTGADAELVPVAPARRDTHERRRRDLRRNAVPTRPRRPRHPEYPRAAYLPAVPPPPPHAQAGPCTLPFLFAAAVSMLLLAVVACGYVAWLVVR